MPPAGARRRRALTGGLADGDARRLLNTLETFGGGGASRPMPRSATPGCCAFGPANCAAMTKAASSSTTPSARCTNPRGSDQTLRCTGLCACSTAALTWRYMARRLIRMASEDIGLATRVPCTWRWMQCRPASAWAALRASSPLAQCVIYLAMAPKSNAAYTAYQAAQAQVRAGGSPPVPLHLRNAPTQLMKDLHYGQGYRYAHDEAGGFAAGEHYWPGRAWHPVLTTSLWSAGWRYKLPSACAP